MNDEQDSARIERSLLISSDDGDDDLLNDRERNDLDDCAWLSGII